MEHSKGIIRKVAGPLVIADGMRDANMFDVVRVSDKKLIGEIIEMHDDRASIQVYEETSGLGPGEEVVSTGAPMSVELGPGLIGSIYDGIQRPLDDIMKVSGNLLKRGVQVPSLKRELKWEFVPTAKVGDMVEAGDVRHSPINVKAVNEQINDVFENMEAYKARLKFKADLMKQRAGQNDVMLAQQFDIIRKNKK